MYRISEVQNGKASRLFENITINGEKAEAYSIRVSAYPYNYGWPGYQRPIEQSEESAFIGFESDEPVTVSLSSPKDFSEAVIRPLSKNVEVKKDGRTVSFTISEPGQYSLELDGWHNNLHIFADKIHDYSMEPSAAYYYGPGVHNVGKVELKSGDTVILDRDAYVIGGFYAVEASDVTIKGYGVIDGSWETRTNDTLLLAVDVVNWSLIPETREEFNRFAEKTSLMVGAIKLYNCTSCKIEGVTIVDSADWVVSCYHCSDLYISNIKEVGMWKYNTDGIDLMNCHDVLVEDCFLRNFDDCLVVKGIKGWDNRNVFNIVSKRLTVWCDWGRALEIGAETCADEYDNVVFDDCDVIHAAFAICDIQNGDRAYVHNVVYSNIRCEYTKYQLMDVLQTDMSVPYDPTTPVHHPRVIFVQGYTGQWSKDGIAGRTDNVLFKNISVVTDDESIGIPVIDIKGYAENHLTSNVTVDNLIFNGRKLSSSEMNLKIGKHTSFLIFK